MNETTIMRSDFSFFKKITLFGFALILYFNWLFFNN